MERVVHIPFEGSEAAAFRAVVDQYLTEVYELAAALMPDDDTAVLAVLRTFVRARPALEAVGDYVSARELLLAVCTGICHEYRRRNLAPSRLATG